jgi:hypothetical protein
MGDRAALLQIRHLGNRLGEVAREKAVLMEMSKTPKMMESTTLGVEAMRLGELVMDKVIVRMEKMTTRKPMIAKEMKRTMMRTRIRQLMMTTTPQGRSARDLQQMLGFRDHDPHQPHHNYHRCFAQDPECISRRGR